MPHTQALGVPRAEIDAALAEIADEEISLPRFKRLVLVGLAGPRPRTAPAAVSGSITGGGDDESDGSSEADDDGAAAKDAAY